MTVPTDPPPDSPFRAAWATCDAPGCGRIGSLADAPWMWDRAAQLPPGWRVQSAARPNAAFYIYCPAHAFRYRGRTPAGRPCVPARRPGYHRILPRWVLRSYSTDRRPCRCGASARALGACWGTHWRRPQRLGHLRPGACPPCAGTLHVGDESAVCPTCGYAAFIEYPEP